MSQIDEIKSRIDIVDLVGETVKLRRSGKNYSGLCPFHSEKTPSFIVSPDRQTWHCFGQCAEGGDIIKFVMKKEGWDFKEALRFLAERAGVKLEAFSPAKQEERDAHERLHGLLEEALTFYRQQLLSPSGKPVQDYLREKRHLTDTTLETFGLGCAPAGWEALLTHFKARAVSESDLQEAGLVSKRESGGYVDRFRNRIMIPIRDEQGRMAGFGARILDPQDFPKFLNSPETALFSKSRILYGLDRARKAIRSADQAVIVEGYLDVIALHQAGFENVVSPMGTALTEEQLRLLKRFTRRIILALDPDAAGRKAVLSGLEAARQALDRQSEAGFDALGLLRHEARLQADLRVAVMPDGLDPDEIVQRSPEEWRSLVEQARPIVVHVMESLAEGRDLGDAKVKSELAAQVLPLIEDLPNPIERDSYRQRLARFLKVDERALVEVKLAAPKSRRPRPQMQLPSQENPPSATRAASSPVEKLEAHVLSQLVRRPDLLFRLDRILQEATLGRLAIEDFASTDHQLLFRLVRQSIEQDADEPDRYLADHLPEPLTERMRTLLSQSEGMNTLDDPLIEDLARAVLSLRRHAYNEQANYYRFQIQEAQSAGSLMTDTYQQRVMELTRSRQLLDQAWKTLNRPKG